VNNEGKELLDLVEDRRWDKRDGRRMGMRGNEKGELTYIREKGESVITF